jgi:hypothetical protein
MTKTQLLDHETTPLLILTTLIALAWNSASALPDNTPVLWNLPGAGEIGLSKPMAVWLIPLAGLAIYMLSLVVSLVPSPVAVHVRGTRVFTVGKSLTLWTLMTVYTIATLSAVSVTMPLGFQVALGIGFLLFLASAIRN